MAKVALSAIEYWKISKADDLRANLPQILPFLNDYLLLAPDNDDVEGEEEQTEVCIQLVGIRAQ